MSTWQVSVVWIEQSATRELLKREQSATREMPVGNQRALDDEGAVMGSERVQPESAQCLARDFVTSDRSRQELAEPNRELVKTEQALLKAVSRTDKTGNRTERIGLTVSNTRPRSIGSWM
jgi:hypothetical protein